MYLSGRMLCLCMVLATGALADDIELRFRNEANAVHLLEVSPARWSKPKRRLILFATPNGNTAEQSYGALAKAGRDWHFDLQHIGAQFRYAQAHSPEVDLALVILQPGQLSWPAFREATIGADAQIRRLVESLQSKYAADETYLTCHSGGGSFLWGWINAYEQLPSSMTRLVWLDANYSYSDQLKHGDKLVEWLQRHGEARLCVVAYDDRHVQYQGKNIVSAEGGTYRASQRMIARLESTGRAAHSPIGDFQATSFFDGRALFLQHPNPQNIILHTALVGEHNGFAAACLWESPNDMQHLWAGPRCYREFIEAEPPRDASRGAARRLVGQPKKYLELPPRADNSETGSAFIQRVAPLDSQARQVASFEAILAGNVPQSARCFIPIEISHEWNGQSHQLLVYVLQDCLAIGSNDDFVRVPLTPQMACRLADRWNCSLPTARLCDHVFDASSLRLKPEPMLQDRELPTTVLAHQRLIESQLQKQLGQLPLEDIVVGHKKDLVLSNALLKKSHRVAIYGWHHPSGVPIQPVYAGHVEAYTDYSHGVRLVLNHVVLDGQPWDYRELLHSEQWHELLSGEGPIHVEALREFSGW